MSAACSCWKLDRGITRRDGSSWDPVSGLCGRCKQPYRRVLPLPVLPAPTATEVRLARVVSQSGPGRPVVVDDLRPTALDDEPK